MLNIRRVLVGVMAALLVCSVASAQQLIHLLDGSFGVSANCNCRRHGAALIPAGLVLCAVLFSPSLLAAQSPPDVDCSEAKTRVEQTVCASPDLVALGQLIADGYAKALPLADSPARDVQQRFQWLQRRDDCNQERGEMLVSCVRSAYEERAHEVTSRLEVLNATVADRLAADTAATQQRAPVAERDLSSSAAQSPPDVDCSEAKTRVDQTVCASPDLVALGQLIADGYAKALPLADSAARDVQQRFQWLQRRDDCNQERGEMLVSCVRSAYEERAHEVISRLEVLNATVAHRLAADTAATQQRALDSVAQPDLFSSAERSRGRDVSQPSNETGPSQSAPARPIAAQPAAQVPSASTTLDNGEGWLGELGELGVFLLFFGLCAFALYFIPTIIAFIRSHRNRWVIFLVNLVFGVTLLGWVGALIWAMNKIDDPLKGGQKYGPQLQDPSA